MRAWKGRIHATSAGVSRRLTVHLVVVVQHVRIFSLKQVGITPVSYPKSSLALMNLERCDVDVD